MAAAAATVGGAQGAARPAPAFPSPSELEAWLRGRGVDNRGWGSGASKSLRNLFDEVAAGESVLFETGPAEAAAAASGALRRVEVVSLTLACPPPPPSPSPPSPPSSPPSPPPGLPMVLVEVSQVLPDGRARARGLVPLGEKMRAGEGWQEAALRGVREELGSAAAAAAGLSSSAPLVALDPESHALSVGPVRDAASYPGLPTVYAVHSARGELSAAAFGAVLPSCCWGAAPADGAAGADDGAGAAAGAAAPAGAADAAAAAAGAAAAAREQGRGEPGGGGRGQVGGQRLEFETVEDVPGKGVHRTTWRWVEERDIEGTGGGRGRGAAGGGGGGATALPPLRRPGE